MPNERDGEVRFMETRDGVIVDTPFGRFEISSRPIPAKGVVHHRIDVTTPEGRKHFKFVELDMAAARHVGQRLYEAAGVLALGAKRA